MKRKLLSALLSALIVVICTVPAAALTGNICDDHCWPKRCPRPGTCGTDCLPRLYWRLRLFDQTCQPRCGGDCLYCGRYMWCDICRKGFNPVVVGNERLCRQAPAVVPIKCDVNCLLATDCTVAGLCNTNCKVGYENVNKRCVLITTTTAPATTAAEFTTVAATIPPEMTTQPPVFTTVAPTIPPEVTTQPPVFTTVAPTIPPEMTTQPPVFTTVAPTPEVTTVAATTQPETTPIVTPPFPCDPNCLSTDTCYVGVNKCDHTCNANYLLVTNFCSECHAYCTPTSPAGCTVPGECTTSCVAPYLRDINTNLCQQCPVTCANCTTLTGCATCGPTTVNNPPTCSACDPHCATRCATASNCDLAAGAACNVGYGLTMSLTPKKCGACDANCNKSTACNTYGSGYCEGTCNPGYLLITSSHQCAPCQTPNPEKCASCSAISVGTCDTCATGFMMTAGYCA